MQERVGDDLPDMKIRLRRRCGCSGHSASGTSSLPRGSRLCSSEHRHIRGDQGHDGGFFHERAAIVASCAAVFLDYETVSTTAATACDPSAIEPAPRARSGITTSPRRRRSSSASRAAEIVLLNKVRAVARAPRRRPRAALDRLGGHRHRQHRPAAAAQERGIAVCNVRGYCTSSVVQHVWAMILSLTQHLPNAAGWRSTGPGRGARSRRAAPTRSASSAGRTLGIVGWGELGPRGRRGSARRSACACSCAAARALRRARTGSPLAELLATADVVSLHCPLTPATRGLIGARELALMKPDALLINTARGGLVDSAALARALKERRLGGAGIDVLPQEPPVDGRAAAGSGDPEFDRHAAHRVGGARGAPALPRRNGRQHPGFSATAGGADGSV